MNTPTPWPYADVAEARVQGMQTKLHRWAAADHSRRFEDVYNLVCDPATLVMAFDRVAGNAGAQTPGMDRTTVRYIQEVVGWRRSWTTSATTSRHGRLFRCRWPNG